MSAHLPDAMLEACSSYVAAHVGLHFPRERWPDLARALQAVAVDLGCDTAEECAQRFVSGRASLHELDALISRLTVGETYFFRDPPAFKILQQRALPELIQARRAGTKRLRIWSAGCSSGEEPYSIAIAVRRALPDFADWDVTILGTDLNPRFLQKAEAGIYSKWSFRGTDEAFQQRYFRRTAKNRYEIVPEIRKLVTFARLNLVAASFPFRITDATAFDIIFCRNVLMYFSHDQAQKVVADLHRALTDDGWLFPSGTEASQELYGRFKAIDASDAIVYRKQSEPAPPQPVPVPLSLPEPAPDPVSIAPPRPVAVPPPPSAADRARELADQGQFAAALAACDEALATDRLAPLPHYLRGLILLEQGSAEEAAATLRRALYLDPTFVLAHFALGNLLRREGRKVDAARCFGNARRLLRDYDPGTILPEADGLTAGRLLATLETLENAA